MFAVIGLFIVLTAVTATVISVGTAILFIAKCDELTSDESEKF